jgi:hypothetical protein
MQIDNLMISGGATIYYETSFRIVLEDHLTYFRNDPKTRQLTIASKDAYKYVGDLFGLLQKNNIAPEYHWLIMRLNNFTAPTDNDDTLQFLYIPDFSYVERLRNVNNISPAIEY